MPTRAAKIPRSLSPSAASQPACHPRSARSAMPATTPGARACLPLSTANSRAPPLDVSARGTHRLLQLHQRLLQSHPAALRPAVSLAPLLQTAEANRATVRHPLNRPPNRGNFSDPQRDDLAFVVDHDV